MNSKNTFISLVLFLPALFGLTGCESAADEKALQVSSSGTALAQPAPLGSYLWALVELEGESPPVSQDPTGAHIIFLEDEGRIAGSTGCNRLMGGYEQTEDGGFKLATVATTMMACPNMEGEAVFLKVLRDYERAVIGASRIRLLDDAGEAVAIFEARALPEND